MTGPVVRHGSRGPITAALALAATLAWSCATPSDHVAPGVRFPKPDRPVAAIVSPEYSHEQTRDRHQEAERVMDRLGIRPGMRVADIGAGLGYYTVRLARRLGPSAAIYAQDVSAEYLDQLRARLERDRVRGITLVLGTPGDPKLPPASIDVAILSHMYHEVVSPFEFLYRLHSSLAPGARVAIIDLDKRTPDHGTPPALLRCELAAVGYRQVDFTVLTPADGYLAVFIPPAELPTVGSIKPCKQ
jgi:ubiquinone/menaquinone biosynthesis C-methylase UbiE